MNDYFPSWLGHALVEDDVPWEAATTATFPTFLQHYSLHDSYWVGLYLVPQWNGVAIVRWDTFWTRGTIPFPGPPIAKWPLLFMRFSGIIHTNIGLEEDGIAGARSAALNAHERDRWELTTDSDIHHTSIEDHCGGIAELVHHPLVTFLCLNHHKEVYTIPIPS